MMKAITEQTNTTGGVSWASETPFDEPAFAVREGGLYVSQKPGEGGKDWGYDRKLENAQALNTYWQRRFASDMRYVNGYCRFYRAAEYGRIVEPLEQATGRSL